MGMEDGSNYFSGGDSGGGGDYAADMGADFVYGYGAGGDGFVMDPGFGTGEPIDWGFDTTSWPTLGDVPTGDIGAGDDFFYGYGAGESVQMGDGGYSGFPGLDPSSGFIDVGDGYYFSPGSGDIIDTGLYQGPDDTWRQIFDDWRAFGVDRDTAAALADQDYQALRESQGVITVSGSEREAPNPPDVSLPFYGLPYVPFTNYWETPPYIPIFPDLPPPAPPPPPPAPQPTRPCQGRTADGFPPSCPAGYGRGPYGSDPCQCYPLPAPSSQGPRPPSNQPPSPQSRPPAPPPAPRPPAQQTSPGCRQGEWRNPATGRCEPIPRCRLPLVFDQRSGRCVSPSVVSPLPGAGGGSGAGGDGSGVGDDLLADLKNFPWWIWVALGGLLLLSKDKDGKSTTVTYRRR